MKNPISTKVIPRINKVKYPGDRERTEIKVFRKL